MVESVGIHTELGEVTLQDLVNEAKKHPEIASAGGIASFLGVVRGTTKNGGEVELLEIEADIEEATQKLQKIADDFKQREGIVDVFIHHNIGKLKVGDDILMVVVAGGHRQDVFPALFDLIERLKAEVPLQKKEYVKAQTKPRIIMHGG